MDKKLQDQLYQKYPGLFIQRTWDKKTTCMCWGIEVGDGWYNLLDGLCSKIMAYCTEHREVSPSFSQIKEKFGLLRIYMDGANEDIHRMLGETEDASGKVCELCGKSDETVTTRGGWLTTQCEDCREGRRRDNLWPRG